MNGVQRITLHHSGDGKPFLATSIADTARHLQAVQRAHFQRGMIDIAYHFAIDRAGRAWQLRSLLYEGQHVRIGQNGTRWNEHNLGIVTLGDFNLQSPTAPQFARLLSLVRLVQQKYAIPLNRVRMHGELVQTDCPGRHLVPLLLDARAKNVL
jgi:N-acetyl-anhydromuramyl-L-alanine amidase AmpD